MLGKLFKHNLKQVSKLLILIHGALLAFSVIGRIIFSMALNGEGDFNTASAATSLITAVYILLYVLGIFCIAVMTYIFLARDFQKGMFSNEGYLMHTLPVTPAQHIWSRCFVFIIWGLIDMIIICASLAIIFINSYTMQYLPEFFQEFWSAMLTAFGTSEFFSTIYMLLTMLISVFFNIFMVYFAICLGSLCKTHKILGAIGSLAGIYLVLQIVGVIMMLTLGWSPYSVNSNNALIATTSTTGMSPAFMGFSIVFDLLLTVGFYLGIHYILSRRLNLE
ncbi:hypothetical protein C3B58_13510 [Lactonifactor longoviformis]|uniref:ABC-2 family transporter protein n=1 Tax=Lactonifactor longoviformis DSM 17459 TaxID=1122155 RepID=A0A1M4U5Q4_9CLOT|nr:hypothetical protein [Lactonifactor longoviformis]POP32093.1 hypothetical protein C3B58_13510 [Lactonifactor longoviformis]SHE52018.1 hypothetical protein SAMN02745158_00746 [Lactonifactor longoviformis DSM 17459]